MLPPVPASSFRFAELLAALSLAIDIGMGQPMEHVLRSCLLSMGLAREIGLAEHELSDLFYVALVRSVGCTADSHEAAALGGGDDIAFRGSAAVHTMGEASDLGDLIHARKASLMAHCEVAAELAEMMGLEEGVCQCLRYGYERWDGEQNPMGLGADAIPVPVRISIVARDMEIMLRNGGLQDAIDLAKHRRGKAYDPQVVDWFCRHSKTLVKQLERPNIWNATLEAEPRPWRTSSEESLDESLRAFALFADLKTVYTQNHSTGVSRLAEGAARQLGVSEKEAIRVRRAAFVHDLGRVGVSNCIWEKAGPLSAGEWERVRLHPYLSERILSRCSALVPMSDLAGTHHERLDGSGYHRGSKACSQDVACRVLAASDVFHAMTEPRAHRSAFQLEKVKKLLAAEGADGRLDPLVVEAVIATSDARRKRRMRASSILTAREVEVLRLLCRGLRNREVAARLGITYKTAGHHVQSIYGKIGVSTRAGAAVFAARHGFLES